MTNIHSKFSGSISILLIQAVVFYVSGLSILVSAFLFNANYVSADEIVLFTDSFDQSGSGITNLWYNADFPGTSSPERKSSDSPGSFGVGVGGSKGLLFDVSNSSDPDDGIERNVATFGYATLRVEYSRTVSGFGSGDEFVFKYSLDGGEFVTKEALSADQSHSIVSFDIPNPDRNTRLTLRFYVNGSGTNDDDRTGLDNVKVYGDDAPDFYDGFENYDDIEDLEDEDEGGWETSETPTIEHGDEDNDKMWTDDNSDEAGHSSSGDHEERGHSVLLEGSGGDAEEADEVIQKTFNTTGLEDVNLRYSRRVNSLEAGESFVSYYSVNGGDSWISLETINGASGNGDDVPFGSVKFGPEDLSGADNNSGFMIRFEINGSDNNDDAYIDDVVVWGDPIPTGSVTIIKNSIPDEQVFYFSTNFDGGFSLDDDPESELTNQKTYPTLSLGEYVFIEGAADNWVLTSISCTDATAEVNLDNREVTLSLEENENITCTFTNTKNGSLVVKKTTDPEGGEGEFEFSGSMEGTLEEDGEEMSFDVIPGEYDVTEATLEGWDLTGISCDDDNSLGDIETRTAHYIIEAGEEVTCIFNSTERGSVTITKLADPLFGPFTFSLISNLLTQAIEAVYQDGLFSCGDNNNYTFWNLLAGDYGIEESVPLDWFGIQTSSCEGWGEDSSSAINLLPGEHVDCVFNNTQFGTIGGVKFEDKNGDGIKDDDGEQGLEGWNITLDYLYGESEPESEFPVTVSTDQNGSYLFSDLVPGTYSVCEEQQPDWEQTLPNGEGGEEGEGEEGEYDEYVGCGENSFGYEVYLSAGENNLDNHFGNFETAKVSGYKWHDLNADGIWQKEDIENLEPALGGWEIRAILANDSEEDEDGESKAVFTDETGYYEFNFNAGEAGEWEISEVLPEPETGGWVQRYPNDPNTYSINVLSGTNEENINFGNQLDEVVPQSQFDNDRNHEVIDTEIDALSLTGSSVDQHSGVQEVTLSIYQLGGSESVENYPGQNFFDVFNELSCPSSQDRHIPIEIVALELVSVSPATNNWEHNWTPPEPGTYCFEVSAEDKVGNIENTAVAGPLAYVPVAKISNESTENITETGFAVEWTTDKPATSRVVYDAVSHSELGEAPNYGYAFSTSEQDIDPKTLENSVALTGLTPGTTYYYRTISAASPESVSEEGSTSTQSQSSDEEDGESGGGGGGGGGVGYVLNSSGLTPTPSPTPALTPSVVPSPTPSGNIAGASIASNLGNTQKPTTASDEATETPDESTDDEIRQEESGPSLSPVPSGITEAEPNFALAMLS